MTSEAHWYHEDGSEHLCDVFGCTNVAVSYWEVWDARDNACWHLCAECAAAVELMLANTLNPVRHTLDEEAYFERHQP